MTLIKKEGTTEMRETLENQMREVKEGHAALLGEQAAHTKHLQEISVKLLKLEGKFELLTALIAALEEKEVEA